MTDSRTAAVSQDPLARPKRVERIVCLTEETTETLYLLGEGARVVGVSGYTVRPPEARRKPRVSAFISARFDRIAALEPDPFLLFPFALFGSWAARHRGAPARVVAGLNLIWVGASFAAIAWVQPNAWGTAFVAVQALAVGGIAAAQFYALSAEQVQVSRL